MTKKISVMGAIGIAVLALLSHNGHTQQKQTLVQNPSTQTVKPTIPVQTPDTQEPTMSLEDLKRNAEERSKNNAEERRGTSPSILNRATAAAASKKGGDDLSVVLIINSENNSQILVLDNGGTWLSDVREVKVSITIGAAILQQKPSVECVMYRGFIRPKNPEIQVFDLESILLADEKEFEEIVNKLHEKK